jgi:hypothetical protein
MLGDRGSIGSYDVEDLGWALGQKVFELLEMLTVEGQWF